MIDAVVDHEFYSSAYASKVQPQAEGLLQSLHDSLVRREKYTYLETGAAKEDATPQEERLRTSAKKLLHRLVSATNRCMHRGLPSVYAYLAGRPTHYTSHEFVDLTFEYTYRSLFKAVHAHWICDAPEIATGEELPL